MSIGEENPKYLQWLSLVNALKSRYGRSLVLAFYIGFSSNSNEALCKLLANLALDKKAYCKKYGIHGIKPEMWPSGILPEAVRCDRGSEIQVKGVLTYL